MHGTLPAERQRAIFPAATVRNESSRTAGSSGPEEISATSCGAKPGWFADLARRLWPKPEKPAAIIRYLTDASERTCHSWVAADTQPPGSTVVLLLQSDEGGRVLDHLMAGNKTAWWKENRRAYGVAAAFDAQRKQVEQLELALE